MDHSKLRDLEEIKNVGVINKIYDHYDEELTNAYVCVAVGVITLGIAGLVCSLLGTTIFWGVISTAFLTAAAFFRHTRLPGSVQYLNFHDAASRRNLLELMPGIINLRKKLDAYKSGLEGFALSEKLLTDEIRCDTEQCIVEKHQELNGEVEAMVASLHAATEYETRKTTFAIKCGSLRRMENDLCRLFARDRTDEITCDNGPFGAAVELRRLLETEAQEQGYPTKLLPRQPKTLKALSPAAT